jgi:hypothetical protein
MQPLAILGRTHNLVSEIVRGQGGFGVQFFDLGKWYHFYADEKLKSLV